MHKIRGCFCSGLFVSIMGIFLVLSGCASTATVQTRSVSGLLDGFLWELPGGDSLSVIGNVFFWVAPDNTVKGHGICTVTADTIRLQMAKVRYGVVVDNAGQAGLQLMEGKGDDVFWNYAANGNTIDITPNQKDDQAQSIWRRGSSIAFESADIPLAGCWQQTRGETIEIFFFSFDGWGYKYICDKNYELKSCRYIDYSSDEPSVFRELLGVEGQTGAFASSYNYKIDGRLYLAVKNADDARAGYYTYFRKDKSAAVDEAEMHFVRAVDYGKKGDHDSAIAEYTQAIRLNPDYHHAYINRGAAYFAQKDPDNAIADYTQAIKVSQNNSTLGYISRGGIYMDVKEDYDSAIADYTEAIRTSPLWVYGYSNRAWAYHKKGDLDRAIADWETVLRLDPNNIQARNNIEIARRERGQ